MNLTSLLLRCAWLLYGLALWATPASAEPPALDARLLDAPMASLTASMAILEDPDHSLALADAMQARMTERFQPPANAAAALNLGHSPSRYWLRLRLQNPGDQPIERMLEVGYARLSQLTLYQPAADGSYQAQATGNALPFAARAYANRYFVFPIALPAHADQWLYLQVQSSSPLIVPARLWTPSAFHAYERKDYSAQALYFGMALTMVLFNLLLYFALRDRVYLLYVLFASCFTLTLAEENGLAKEFLWGDAPLWSNIATGVGFSWSCGIFLVFMRQMLNTASLLPRLDRAIRLLVALFLLSPLAFLTDFDAAIQPAVALWSLTMLLILGVGLYGAFRRQRTAYFFVAAFAIGCFGGIAAGLKALGWMPSNLLSVNLLQLGSAIEMLLMALALADRFNLIRREKAAAQQAALDAQQLMLHNLQSHERLLEARVAERTDALQLLNRQLEALSTTDGLTGIANRRHFDQVLAREWRRAARTGQPLALAILDVDWFKKYNDHYGHQAGDDCLRQVAGILASHASRASDLVARYGGEEFVLVTPATDGPSALQLAQRICTDIQALALPHAVSEFGCVTASIGVAALLPQEGQMPELLLHSADKALYQAKAQGRNQALLA
nr:diguanylate cyclase [uncultured Albidiferax sp.]